MDASQHSMEPEERAIQDVQQGNAITVLFDMTKEFGPGVSVDLNYCMLVDLEGVEGVYGILSNSLQTLVGVTSNSRFLFEQTSF